jgi:hypothetical protein
MVENSMLLKVSASAEASICTVQIISASACNVMSLSPGALITHLVCFV